MDKENRFCVYIHIRLDTKIPFYVGKGVEKRAKSKFSRNKYWHNIVNKVGFVVKILKKDLNEQKAFEIEKKLIKSYRKFGWAAANITDGGEGNCGYKPTKETLKLLSERLKGKTHSQEWKDAMSARLKGNKINLGRKKTEEQKKQISIKVKGRRHSPETILKMKGRKPSKKCIELSIQRRCKKIIDLSTGIVYKSRRDASKFLNINECTITEHAKNRTNVKKFQFYNEEVKYTLGYTRKYNSTPVVHIESNRVFLRIKDAAKFYNCSINTITKHCKRKVLNPLFKYKEKDDY